MHDWSTDYTTISHGIRASQINPSLRNGTFKDSKNRKVRSTFFYALGAHLSSVCRVLKENTPYLLHILKYM